MISYRLVSIVCLFSVTVSCSLAGVGEFGPAIIASGLVHLMLTLYAGYMLLIRKESLGDATAIGFTFLFFFFEPLNPYNYGYYSQAFLKHSTIAIILGFACANLAPLFLMSGIRVWGKFLKPFEERLKTPMTSASRTKFLRLSFYGFCVVFTVTFLVYLAVGDLVMLSVRQIVALRAGKAEFATFGAAGGFTGLIDLPYNCVLFSLLLWKTRYRKYVILVSPLVILWSLGLALGGTRTMLILLIIMLGVVFIGFTQMNVRKLTTLLVVALVCIIFSQLAVKARRSGWSNFKVDNVVRQVVDIQGLQGLEDQTRAFEYVLEDYYPLWMAPNSGVGLPLGIVHRGAEFIYHWVPRMFFPQKPLDPTFVTFTEYSHLILRGSSKQAEVGVSGRHTGLGNNMTAGLFGRDVVRYGLFGPLVTTFWLSLLLYFAQVCFRWRRANPYGLYIAAATAATVVSMFRGLEMLWTVHMMPFVYITLPLLMIFNHRRFSR